MKEEVIIDTSVKGSDKAESQLKGVADATNEANDASEEYTETLTDSAKELEIFGVSLGGMISGFKNSVGAIGNSVKSLKAFKIALAATGVGLLVIALASLVKWLQSSQQGLDFIEDSFTKVKAVIDALIGTLTKFGSALAKIFTGDIRGGLRGMRDAFTGIGDAIRDNINAQLEFNQLIRANDEFNRNNIITLANIRNELAKNRLVANDIEGGLQNQIQAAERIIELTQEQGRINEESAQRNVDQIKARIDNERAAQGITGELRDDELEEIFIAQAKVIDAQSSAFIAEVTGLRRLNTLKKQIVTETAQVELEIVEVAKETELEALTTITESTKEQILARMALNAEAHQLRLDQLEEDRMLVEENARIEFQMKADLLGALANLAGQDTVLGQALAVAQASINTQIGITAALGLPTLVQKALGIALAVTTGLSAIRDIRSEPIPQFKLNTTSPFAKGGMIGGNLHSHKSGGTWVLAERGEGIINRNSMSIPWVKRQASYLNTLGGGIPFMQDGGLVPSSISGSRFVNLERALSQSRPVLITNDLHQAELRDSIVEVVTTL